MPLDCICGPIVHVPGGAAWRQHWCLLSLQKRGSRSGDIAMPSARAEGEAASCSLCSSPCTSAHAAHVTSLAPGSHGDPSEVNAKLLYCPLTLPLGATPPCPAVPLGAHVPQTMLPPWPELLGVALPCALRASESLCPCARLTLGAKVHSCSSRSSVESTPQPLPRYPLCVSRWYCSWLFFAGLASGLMLGVKVQAAISLASFSLLAAPTFSRCFFRISNSSPVRSASFPTFLGLAGARPSAKLSGLGPPEPPPAFF